ncbi:pectinesterase 2, partial [Physcomitrium patens]|uniref:pectinesterase 2 n=1 Tax=Physcomitrium patens TaxID=3218 RepID=UPI003CCD1FFD
VLRAEEGPIYELSNYDNFPEWIRLKDRKLLQSRNTNDITIVNAVVAKDGYGEYHIIQETIDAAPKDIAMQWVIRIKAGVYNEYVEVPKSVKNLVILGDGVDQSVVGYYVTTFATATMAVLGEHFIGRDFTVRWRSRSRAISAHSGDVLSRGTKTHSTLTATGNFIRAAGSSAQWISFSAMLPPSFSPALYWLVHHSLSNKTPSQPKVGPPAPKNTGLSFQNCVVDAASELKNLQNQTVNCYLGRPWNEFSRTVFLMSTLTNGINPEGWLPWNGALFLNTVFYGE